MAALSAMVLAHCLASAGAFVTPRGSTVLQPVVASALGRTQSEPSPFPNALLTAGAAALVLLGSRRPRQPKSRIVLQAAKEKMTQEQQREKEARESTERKIQAASFNSFEKPCNLTIRKTKNNTHVTLIDSEWKIRIFYTTEKRFGKVLPNAQRAVESCLFAAVKIGITHVNVSYLGTIVALSSIINVIKASGISVKKACMKDNIRRGGCRQRRPRHV